MVWRAATAHRRWFRSSTALSCAVNATFSKMSQPVRRRRSGFPLRRCPADEATPGQTPQVAGKLKSNGGTLPGADAPGERPGRPGGPPHYGRTRRRWWTCRRWSNATESEAGSHAEYADIANWWPGRRGHGGPGKGRSPALERSSRSKQKLRLLLTPRDPNDDRNVVLEIRAGTGGDEAAFAADLFRIQRYAERQGWKIDAMSTSDNGVGGLKEVIATVEGERVRLLKHESGVHRVQRVPTTEACGRFTLHATVAVLPEAEEVDVQIEAKDLRIDTFCSSGPGGQSVNTTYSASGSPTCRPA